MTYYIYSTATSGTNYTKFKRVTKDLNQPVHSVHIAGGSNVMQKNLVTPLGVMTKVTDDDYEFLKEHPLFKKHLERGYIKVEKSKKDPERVVGSGMEISDNAAPLTPNNIAERTAGKIRESAAA